jgi:hypothetical protein
LGTVGSFTARRKDEAFVDMILSEITGDRKVRTPEELEVVMKEPRGAAPTRNVWMHESLVDDARRLWESSRLGG